MIFMKNEKYRHMLDNIKPDPDTEERMLKNILEKNQEKRRPRKTYVLAAAGLAVIAALILILPRITKPRTGTSVSEEGSTSTEIPSESETEKSNLSDRPNVHVEIDYVGLTLDQYIEESPYIFVGKCTSRAWNNSTMGWELGFDIERSLRGTYEKDLKMFRAADPGDYYVKGSTYLLFCSKMANVFKDETFYYVSLSVYDTPSGLGHHQGLIDCKEENMDAVISYTEAYVQSHPYSKEENIVGDYCHSSDLKKICDFSTHVFTAEITGIMMNDVEDRTTYTFAVKEELKGHLEEEKWIVAYKDYLKIGDTALFLLKKPDETSLLLTVSSVHSVLDPDSEEAEEVRAYLQENRGK